RRPGARRRPVARAAADQGQRPRCPRAAERLCLPRSLSLRHATLRRGNAQAQVTCRWPPHGLPSGLRLALLGTAMKSTFPFALGAVVMALAMPFAAGAPRVSDAALANAGRQATLKMIDYGRQLCDGQTTVEEWLTAFAGKQAPSIPW